MWVVRAWYWILHCENTSSYVLNVNNNIWVVLDKLTAIASQSSTRKEILINRTKPLQASMPHMPFTTMTTAVQVPPEVTLVKSKLDDNTEVCITTKMKELLDFHLQSKNVQEFTSSMKRWLDNSYGKLWNVVCTDGSYWMNYGYEDAYSLHVNIYSYHVMLWKSPYASVTSSKNCQESRF